MAPPNDGSAWTHAYRLFSLHPDAFYERYHPRSKAESCFSMIKRNYGEPVLSRSGTEQINEVLCKVLYHNICVLLHARHELSIDPELGLAASAVA